MENPIIKRFAEQYDSMADWVGMNIAPLSDEEFRWELSPGKNHGVWLLGHLITSDDDFSLFMGRGEMLYPEYPAIFGEGSKLQPVENYPDVSLLKEQWKNVVRKNKKVYAELKDAELDERHGLIKSDEDFEKDFFKTKFGVITHWQLHQMYHAGQLSVLVSRAGKSAY